MGDAFANSFRECPECGGKFSLFLYNTKEYVYKVKDGTSKKYLCSYPCYRKYKAKVEARERQR